MSILKRTKSLQPMEKSQKYLSKMSNKAQKSDTTAELYRLCDQYQTQMSQNHNMTIYYDKDVNGGATINSQNAIIIGMDHVKSFGFINNKVTPLNLGDTVNTMFHEFTHVQQADVNYQPQSGISPERIVKSKILQFACPTLYANTYYANGMEQDAYINGIQKAREYMKTNYPESLPAWEQKTLNTMNKTLDIQTKFNEPYLTTQKTDSLDNALQQIQENQDKHPPVQNLKQKFQQATYTNPGNIFEQKLLNNPDLMNKIEQCTTLSAQENIILQEYYKENAYAFDNIPCLDDWCKQQPTYQEHQKEFNNYESLPTEHTNNEYTPKTDTAKELHAAFTQPQPWETQTNTELQY